MPRRVIFAYPRHGQVELVLAHPSGITEIEVGTYTADGATIELEMTTTQIGMTPTAKDVTSLGRRFRLSGDELSYSLQMGAVGQPMQHHLGAVLRRTKCQRLFRRNPGLTISCRSVSHRR